MEKNERPLPPHKEGDLINGGREIVTAVYWKEAAWDGLTQSWERAGWVVETRPNPNWSPLSPETTAAIAACLEWQDVADLAAGEFPLRVERGLNDKVAALIPPGLDLGPCVGYEEKAALVPRLAEAVKRLRPEEWRRTVIRRQFAVRCAELRAAQKAALKRELAAVEPQIAAIKADPASWREIEYNDRLRDEDGAPYGSSFRNTERVLTPEARSKIEALETAARQAAGWRSDAEIAAEVKAAMTPEERACL